MSLEYFSYSRLNTFQRCNRLFKFKYLDKRDEQQSELSYGGTVWHKLLENRLRTKSDKMAPDSGLEQLSQKDQDLMRLIYARYCDLYRDDSTWRVLALEEEREYDLRGQRFKFIPDGIIETSAGEMYILEHKLTKTASFEEWMKYRVFDMQTDLYLYAARQLGYPVSGVLLDVARRPMNRPRALESHEDFIERVSGIVDDDYFLRHIIPYDQARVDRVLDDATGIVGNINGATRYPRNVNACYGFGSTCQFLPECEPKE